MNTIDLDTLKQLQAENTALRARLQAVAQAMDVDINDDLPGAIYDYIEMYCDELNRAGRLFRAIRNIARHSQIDEKTKPEAMFNRLVRINDLAESALEGEKKS